MVKSCTIKHNNHKQKLLYATLSRETSRESKSLANKTNDFAYHNAYGSTALSIKEVRDEFLRLANYHLTTITVDIKRLVDTATAESDSSNA